MHISHVAIRNLRALEDIDCEFSPRINVIVGPNAVGKTRILQALRLSKALLAPRTQQETQQVLVSPAYTTASAAGRACQSQVHQLIHRFTAEPFDPPAEVAQ